MGDRVGTTPGVTAMSRPRSRDDDRPRRSGGFPVWAMILTAVLLTAVLTAAVVVVAVVAGAAFWVSTPRPTPAAPAPPSPPPPAVTDADPPKGEWARDLDAEVKRISGELAAAKDADAPPPAKRFILVAFTGETCTNCRLNERTVFPVGRVRALLDQYTLVRLYTDDVPAALYDDPPPPAQRRADADRNDALLRTKFGTSQLPTYVILEPQPVGDPKVVGVYPEGRIDDVPGFVKFLQEPLKK